MKGVNRLFEVGFLNLTHEIRSDANVIKLRIFVLRIFSPYFQKTENGSVYLHKIQYGNTEKLSVMWKYRLP